MQGKRFTKGCRAFARACTASIVVDTYSPRPGLSTVRRWRRDPGPLSFAILAPLAYELCLKACRAGATVAQGTAREGTITSIWRKTVETVAKLGLGNPGLGSTMLLAFQAAALGYSLEAYESDSIDHVMGSVNTILEAEGTKGLRNLYRAITTVSPSYIHRIAWQGLPDTSTRKLAEQETLEKRLTLKDALALTSLYDPVSRDLYTSFTISLGYAYPLIIKHSNILKAVAKATYAVAGWHDDLILKRKLGKSYRKLWEAAFRETPEALTLLKTILANTNAGPGSSADIVVNATARAIYEYITLTQQTIKRI